MRIQSYTAHSGHFSKSLAKVAFAGVLEDQQALLAQRQKERESLELQARLDELNQTCFKDGDTQWSKLKLLRLVDEMARAEVKSPGNIAAWVLSPLTLLGTVAGFVGIAALAGDVPHEIPDFLKKLFPVAYGEVPEENLLALFDDEDTRTSVKMYLGELASLETGLLNPITGYDNHYSVTTQGVNILAKASETSLLG